ncbi:MAG: LLM class flavin-dependent oxidoreductase, partial [Maritimibacter sp.]
STALGVWTEKIKLIVACRSGLMSPTAFVQQINTLSVLTQGRVALNIVAGHTPQEQRYYGDFMTHDQRFSRTGEYVAVCRALWRDGVEGEGVNFSGKYYRIKNAKLKTPFIVEADVSETASLTGTSAHRRPALFVAGSSVQAQVLAKKLGDIWVCVAEAPAALAEKILDVPAALRPTALLCANDLMAVGCYEFLKEAGLRIPEDVAVVGFDNREIAQFMRPPLTTLVLPHYDMGAAAVDQVLDFAAGLTPRHNQLKVECELIERESV